MKICTLKSLNAVQKEKLLKRASINNPLLKAGVLRMMNNVKIYGDRVIVEAFRKKYGAIPVSSLRVTDEEVQYALSTAPEELLRSLDQMIKNIRSVHSSQLPEKIENVVKVQNGISVWRQWRAIENVGLYIPGGKAVYPSSVLMSAIPAQIAGCKNIIMCSPPRSNGDIPSETLVAAGLLGITNIYKIGGVNAIAAMTYGTETVPKVNKIFGAGNAYVTAAKMIALETISIDMPAGPSEVLIIADDTANPEFIAADLLADGEHGSDSACVLVTTSQRVAKRTQQRIKSLLSKYSSGVRARESFYRFGMILLASNLKEAVQFANTYAPEHLEIMTNNPEELVAEIQNAGSVFIGDWTSKSAGDYATGANHVLPTGGMAATYPPLGVDAYGKWMQIQKCTRSGLQKIRNTIEILAKVEELPYHGYSTAIRFKEKYE